MSKTDTDNTLDTNARDREPQNSKATMGTEPTVEQLLERNKQKDSKQAFAEDLVYTLNHAIVCATSDVIDPFIGAWTQKYLGRRLVMNPLHDWAHNKFEHHDHDHPHDPHDHHHGGEGHGESFWNNLGHWVVGEAVGDIGAVPFTLGLQYAAPGVMKGIQHTTEPLLGGAFRWSAERYAKKWAYEHGLAEDSPEAKARAQELYDHEVEHLPHAFVWTGSAAGINVLTQKFITGNKAPTKHLILGKAFGSLGTLALVLGLRTLAPGTIQGLDEWNTKNLAEPLTRRTTRLLGIDEETVKRVFDEEKEFADGKHIIERGKQIRERARGEGNEPQNQASESPTTTVATQQVKMDAKVMAPFSLMRAIG